MCPCSAAEESERERGKASGGFFVQRWATFKVPIDPAHRLVLGLRASPVPAREAGLPRHVVHDHASLVRDVVSTQHTHRGLVVHVTTAKLPRRSLAEQVLGVHSTEKWARGRPQEHTRHRLRTALNARMKLIEPPLQDKFRVRRPCRTRRKHGQDYVERPPLVEWGGWHLIAGGKDRESRDLWKKITKLSTKMLQEGPPPEVPINV